MSKSYRKAMTKYAYRVRISRGIPSTGIPFEKTGFHGISNKQEFRYLGIPVLNLNSCPQIRYKRYKMFSHTDVNPNHGIPSLHPVCISNLSRLQLTEKLYKPKLFFFFIQNDLLRLEKILGFMSAFPSL